MEINPYASPVEFSAKPDRSPLLRPLALLASVAVFFWTLIDVWNINFPTVDGCFNYARQIYVRKEDVFLAESAIMAILGIVTFNGFARAIAGDRIIYVGRTVCVAQLIATAVLPLLDRSLRDICVLSFPILFACGSIAVLHFTLKRFEPLPTPAARWTIRAIIPADAVAILAVYLKVEYEALGFLQSPGGLGWLVLFGLFRGQAIVCGLLALRLFEVHRSWRSEAQPQSGN